MSFSERGAQWPGGDPPSRTYIDMLMELLAEVNAPQVPSGGDVASFLSELGSQAAGSNAYRDYIRTLAYGPAVAASMAGQGQQQIGPVLPLSARRGTGYMPEGDDGLGPPPLAPDTPSSSSPPPPPLPVSGEAGGVEPLPQRGTPPAARPTAIAGLEAMARRDPALMRDYLAANPASAMRAAFEARGIDPTSSQVVGNFISQNAPSADFLAMLSGDGTASDPLAAANAMARAYTSPGGRPDLARYEQGFLSALQDPMSIRGIALRDMVREDPDQAVALMSQVRRLSGESPEITASRARLAKDAIWQSRMRQLAEGGSDVLADTDWVNIILQEMMRR